MKGLLLKDLYLVNKYCRSYLLIAVLFLAMSLFGDNNMFFVVYPCLFASLIPVTLLAYDERSKWEQFCGALPYTKAQLVSAKYLVGLIIQCIMLLLTSAAQAYRMIHAGTFQWGSYLTLLVALLFMSGLVSSLALPLMFKLGTEKGRVAYYIMVGAVCGLSVAGVTIFRSESALFMHSALVIPVMFVVTLVLYVVSWRVSIAFYQKREI